MAQPHHQLVHVDMHYDLHGSERFKQLELPNNDSQLQGETPEDEQHKLGNYDKENVILTAKTSISLENQKHLHENERSKYNESAKAKQCIPDTHLTTNLSNEITNETILSPVTSSAHPQSYLNMDSYVSMADSEQTDSQKQQDMLFILPDKTSHSSDNNSKVTNF
jgi:oligoribonuclease NrnB/cAMP/cGMP phosphodiesterase (DHH superfamily)